MKKLIAILLPFLLLLTSCHHNEEMKESQPTHIQLCERSIKSFPISVTGLENARKYCMDVEFNNRSLELRRNEYLFVSDVYNALNSLNNLLNILNFRSRSPTFFGKKASASEGVKVVLSGAMNEAFEYIEDLFRRIKVITAYPEDDVTMEVSGVNVRLGITRWFFPNSATSGVRLSLNGIWSLPEVYFWGAIFSGLYGLWDFLISQNLGSAAEWIYILDDYSKMVGDEGFFDSRYVPHFIAHVLGNYRKLFTWSEDGKRFYLKSRIYFEGMLSYVFGRDDSLSFPVGATFVAPAGEGLIELLKNRLVPEGSESPFYISIVDKDGNGEISLGDYLSIEGIRSIYRYGGNSNVKGYILNPFTPSLLTQFQTLGKKVIEQLENYNTSVADIEVGKFLSGFMVSLAEILNYSGDVTENGFPEVFLDFGALYRVVDNSEFIGFRSFLPAWVYNGAMTRDVDGYRVDLDKSSKPFDYLLMWEVEVYGGENYNAYGLTTKGESPEGPFLEFLVFRNDYNDVSHFDLFISSTGKLNPQFLYGVKDPTDAIISNLAVLPPDGLKPPRYAGGSILMYFDWQDPTLWGFIKVDRDSFPSTCKPSMEGVTDEKVLRQIEINGVLNCALIHYWELFDAIDSVEIFMK